MAKSKGSSTDKQSTEPVEQEHVQDAPHSSDEEKAAAVAAAGTPDTGVEEQTVAERYTERHNSYIDAVNQSTSSN